jgi:hypothetical protein
MEEIMRIKIYLDKAEKGKTEPELSKEELKTLVPDWDSLENEDRISKLEATAVDEKIISGDMETYLSIVEQIAENMGKKVNLSDDTEAETLLGEFNRLPEADRRKLGIW